MRTPRKSWATSSIWSFGSRTRLYQATGGLPTIVPVAASSSRTNWSYGLLASRLSRTQAWKAKLDTVSLASSRRFFRRAVHLPAKKSA